MKLSQIEKRIPQTLTNSKDIIQTDREYARRSSRARSTRGQENEAWALYKKIPSRESWGDLSRDRYIICPKPPSPAGKILDRRQLFFLAVIVLPSQSQFPRALRTTTTNNRVSFIDLYSVFFRNFRIVVFPYTNAVILLEPYCGTTPEPGLPVVGLFRLCSATFGVWSKFLRF